MHLGMKKSIKNIFNEERDVSRIFNELLFQKEYTRAGGEFKTFVCFRKEENPREYCHWITAKSF